MASGVIIRLGNTITNINTVSSELPKDFKLLQNYPNPFNPTTNIKFSIPHNVFVSLKVYDIEGREVAKLVNTELKSGTYECNWNATNCSSGIYFYKFQAGNYLETKKMIFLK
jgi:hypothetical protein